MGLFWSLLHFLNLICVTPPKLWLWRENSWIKFSNANLPNTSTDTRRENEVGAKYDLTVTDREEVKMIG